MPTLATDYSRVGSIDASAKRSRIRPVPSRVPNIRDKNGAPNCLTASNFVGQLFNAGEVVPELMWRFGAASNGTSTARGSAGFRTNL
jgi:hypothetical protein